MFQKHYSITLSKFCAIHTLPDMIAFPFFLDQTGKGDYYSEHIKILYNSAFSNVMGKEEV